MYTVRKIRIKENDILYGYCMDICGRTKRLYNTANFYIRQNMSGLKKPHEERQPAENDGIRKVMCGIERLNRLRQHSFEKKMDTVRNDGKLSDSEKAAMIAGLDRPTVVPFPSEKKWFLGYNTLEGILKTLNDRNYSSLPAQTAQQVVKQVTGDWNSYFKSLEAYRKKPELFTGRPGIVKYKKKGSLSSAVFTYQQCRVRENQNGKTYMKLPLTEHKLWVGKLPDGMRFVQAEIIPAHGVFEISLTFNVLKDSMAVPEKHGRIAGMDLGVDNLAAITDNIGSKPVIIKGRALKSLNRYVNKNVACLQSVLDGGTENGKELTASERKGIRKKIDRLWMKRESFMSDYFHKAAKQAVEYLKSSGIDTLVVGYNPGWKQKSGMGEANNQNFAGIPFYRFINMLAYLCERNGIGFIRQEESYTSMASFKDNDYIPVYGGESKTPVFSGKRIARGLYRSADGAVINADVNGSLNIIRKCFPDAFKGMTGIGHLAVSEVWDFDKFYGNIKVKVS